MARWIGTGALALAWATFAAGQVPTPAPAATAPAGPRVGEVMTFRTSGQPERRVRIVRVIGTPEADGLADVQDLGTGAKYSVPLKVVALMARGSSPETPEAAAPAAPPALSGGASGLPGVAQTLPSVPPAGDNGWPKNSTPAVAAKSRQPAAGSPPSGRAALPPPTNVRTLMRPDPPSPEVAARAAPPAPVPTFSLPQRPRTDSATAVRPAPPVVTVEAVVDFRPSSPSVTVEVADAGAATPPDRADPAGVRSPQVAVAPPEYVVVPVLDYSPAEKPTPAVPETPTPTPTAVPDRFGPPPVTPLAEAKAATESPVAAPFPAPLPPPVVPASRVAPAAPVADPVPSAGVPPQMLAEVQPLVNDLFQALRPSLRERAATGLAEGRYGSRPEVKATLARAALTDPAPTVRAHCIAQLARLGYHEPSYLGYLDACAESGQAAVKQAAVAALAKLASRN